MNRFVLFWLSWMGFASLGLAASKGVLLNGTAASVGKTLITLQDAYFYRALQRLEEGASDVLAVEEGDLLRKTVQKMAFEEMVFAEMKSLQVALPIARSEAEKMVRARLVRVKDLSLKRVLQRFGKTRGLAEDRLEKSLQVERFVQQKAETLTPIVTEAEVDKYYAQNKALQGSPIESLRPNITLLLKKERMEKGLEEWVRTLKEKYQVTNYLEG